MFEVLLTIETLEDYENFFLDLCTPAEVEAMADRWEVAQLLHQNMPYREIYKKTGVSTATVTRVARSLVYGQGYRKVLDRGSRAFEAETKKPIRLKK